MSPLLVSRIDLSVGSLTIFGPILAVSSLAFFGDIFDFIYIPNAGITVLKNEEQINSILGLEFKKAFFGVWLSDNPVQENLKKAMLGG